MLVLTRKLGESVVIGDDIKITVLIISEDQIYLDVNISESITVHLQETISIRDDIKITVVKIDKTQNIIGTTTVIYNLSIFI